MNSTNITTDVLMNTPYVEFNITETKFRVPFIGKTPVYNKILTGSQVVALQNYGINLEILSLHDSLPGSVSPPVISIEVANAVAETPLTTEVEVPESVEDVLIEVSPIVEVEPTFEPEVELVVEEVTEVELVVEEEVADSDDSVDISTLTKEEVEALSEDELKEALEHLGVQVPVNTSHKKLARMLNVEIAKLNQ